MHSTIGYRFVEVVDRVSRNCRKIREVFNVRILAYAFSSAAVVLLVVGPANIGRAQRPSQGVPWPATDALGRTLPLGADVGPPRANRTVGMFYFLWHENRPQKNSFGDGPYDIAHILPPTRESLDKPASPLWGPFGVAHYWAQPLFGYYRERRPVGLAPARPVAGGRGSRHVDV